MTQRVLVPLAPGFEEIEAVTLIDVLRRAGLEVVAAGLAPGSVRGSRDVSIVPDALLRDVDPESFDLVVLPGGMDGTLAMMADERLLEIVRAHFLSGRLTAAICAAPLVLVQAGITAGRAVTSHPSVRDQLGVAELRPEVRVVRSGNLVTSQGPGTAMEFALALVEELRGRAERDRLATAMVVRG